MSAQHPPLTCDAIKKALSSLGFKPRPKKSGTSHEDWVGENPPGRFRKVTVDCPKAPFTQDLIASMANQAGLKKKQLYELAGYPSKGKNKEAELATPANPPADPSPESE